MAAAKKVLASVVALAIAGGTGWYVMRQRVVANVEAQFDSLRTVLAKAEHGVIAVDLWSRTVRIADIKLVPKDAGADRSVTIAGVTASGTASIDGAVSADRLEFKEIESNIPFVEQAGAESKHSVPSVFVEGFSMRALAAGGSQGGGAAGLFGAMSARSIAAPTVKTGVSVTVPQPTAKAGQPPVTTRVEQTQFDTRIEDLRGGRIGKLTVARMEMTMPMQTPLGGEMKLEMRDAYATGYDIGALLTAFTGDAPAKLPDGPVTLCDTAGIGPVTARVGTAGSFAMVGASMGKVTIDPVKLRPAWQVIKSMQATAMSGAPALKPQTQIFESLADVYESIGMASFEYRGLSLDVAGMAPFKLGRVAIDKFEKGSVGRLSVDDLDGALPTKERYRLKHFGLKGFNIAQLLRLSGRATAGGMSPAAQSQQMWDVLKMTEGFEIDGLEYPDKASRQTVKVERLSADWKSFVGRLPLSGGYEIKASVPIDANPRGNFATLAPMGLSNATIAHSGGWSWQEASQTIVFGPIDLTMAGVGEASAEIRLEGVSRQFLNTPPELMPMMVSELRLGPIKISARDTGLLKLLAKDPAFVEKHRQFLAALKTPDPAAPAEPAELVEIKAGLARFLDNPGERLVVELKPKGSISLAEVLASGKTGPEMLTFLAGRMTSSVTVSPAR